MSERPVKYLDAEAFRKKLESLERVALYPSGHPHASIGVPALVDETDGVTYVLRAEDRL